MLPKISFYDVSELQENGFENSPHQFTYLFFSINILEISYRISPTVTKILSTTVNLLFNKTKYTSGKDNKKQKQNWTDNPAYTVTSRNIRKL